MDSTSLTPCRRSTAPKAFRSFESIPKSPLISWMDSAPSACTTHTRALVVFSRQHRNSEAEAHKRLKKQLFDYGLDIAPGVAVYADPSTRSPGFCGHMINDPRGTGAETNCVECPIGGGALIGILTLRDVREGEELLMDYGERYWQARS